jgi:hypothetical protein
MQRLQQQGKKSEYESKAPTATSQLKARDLLSPRAARAANREAQRIQEDARRAMIVADQCQQEDSALSEDLLDNVKDPSKTARQSRRMFKKLGIPHPNPQPQPPASTRHRDVYNKHGLTRSDSDSGWEPPYSGPSDSEEEVVRAKRAFNAEEALRKLTPAEKEWVESFRNSRRHWLQEVPDAHLPEWLFKVIHHPLRELLCDSFQCNNVFMHKWLAHTESIKNSEMGEALQVRYWTNVLKRWWPWGRRYQSNEPYPEGMGMHLEGMFYSHMPASE